MHTFIWPSVHPVHSRMHLNTKTKRFFLNSQWIARKEINRLNFNYTIIYSNLRYILYIERLMIIYIEAYRQVFYSVSFLCSGYLQNYVLRRLSNYADWRQIIHSQMHSIVYCWKEIERTIGFFVQATSFHRFICRTYTTH